MRSAISGCAPVLTVLLTYVGGVQGAVNQTALAANLEHFWSYGRSPPVYPSPQMSGSGAWEASYEYALQLVAQMTNGEKNNLTYGYVTILDHLTNVDINLGIHRPPTAVLAIYLRWKDLDSLECVFKILATAFEAPTA